MWEFEVSRREFSVLAGAAAVTLGAMTGSVQAKPDNPWYRRIRRWGQINITEDNVSNFDIEFWRDYANKTATQGMILNAGGILAYYPTALPDQPRAFGIDNRDLFGELSDAFRKDGMEIMARLSYTISQAQLRAHPDWGKINVNGKPTGGACMNGGFTYDYGASVVKEVATRYRPVGFTLSGWGHDPSPCYCDICKKLFRNKTGKDLPRAPNWDDPVFRQWVHWNLDQVVALWDYQSKIAKDAGGPNCLWLGQTMGGFPGLYTRKIAERSQVLMIDGLQGRAEDSGFHGFADAGKVMRSVLGWDKPVMACQGIWFSRLGSRPILEAQMWMNEAWAGGFTPWWHSVSAYNYDKRRFTAPIGPFNWHKDNEQYLLDRTPVASVGLVWSEDNVIFHGRDDVDGNVRDPWMGMVLALVRARIPYVVVHAEFIDRDAGNLSTLVLPNLAAMSDAQATAIKRFVARGGSVVATGDTSLYDQEGVQRTDFALADVFGAHFRGRMSDAANFEKVLAFYRSSGASLSTLGSNGLNANQNYLLLTPQMRRNVPGPHRPDEPIVPPGTGRHPALNGLDETDIIFFGGTLNEVSAASGSQVLMSYVPPVVTQPVEQAYFRPADREIPGLIVRSGLGGGRVAFLPADLDRRYKRLNHPDHARVLSNLVRWAAGGTIPLEVSGPGLIECNLYQQPNRMILHLTNLNNAGTWKAPLEDLLPIGPVTIRIKLNRDVSGGRVKLLVSNQQQRAQVTDGWATIRIANIVDHEVMVIS